MLASASRLVKSASRLSRPAFRLSRSASRLAGIRPALLAVSTALASLTLYVGCSHAPPPAPAATDTRPTGLEPVTTEPPLSPEAQRLAEKTEQYAQNVGDAPPTQTPLITNNSADNAGGVHWADPNAFRLTPLPDQQPETAPVQGTMDATPRPRPMAPPATAPARPSSDNPLPAVVPEGQDTLTPAAPSAPSTSSASTPAANSSTPAMPAESSDALQNRLLSAVHDYPRDVASQMDLQLLRFVQGRPTPDLSLIAGLPQEDRDIVTTLMDGLSNFRETVRADNNMLLSRKIQPLLDMADRLRSQAELTIPTIALCTRVDGFGNYTPIDPARFPAGQGAAMVVYCEVQNFASQLNDKQLWETKLTQEAVLYSDTGMQVWPTKSEPIQVTDQCRDHRHDFYVINILHLPSDLTIGRYLLKVTITDTEANHVAEATAPMEFVAQ